MSHLTLIIATSTPLIGIIAVLWWALKEEREKKHVGTYVLCDLKRCVFNRNGICGRGLIYLREEHDKDGGCDLGWKFKKEVSYETKEPTADVVEVVRCRDCRHYAEEGKTTRYAWCHKWKNAVNFSDFCSYGERA